jgi:hypothetical protein
MKAFLFVAVALVLVLNVVLGRDTAKLFRGTAEKARHTWHKSKTIDSLSRKNTNMDFFEEKGLASSHKILDGVEMEY